jgi:hypothetical protein
MQFQFHGIGMMYGERGYWPDGSFVTTEWFAVAWVPIFPICSKRVSYAQNSAYAVYDHRGYWVHETSGPDLTQVLSTYEWFGSFFAIVAVWANFQDVLSRMARGRRPGGDFFPTAACDRDCSSIRPTSMGEGPQGSRMAACQLGARSASDLRRQFVWVGVTSPLPKVLDQQRFVSGFVVDQLVGHVLG